jgi:hypothetical protein
MSSTNINVVFGCMTFGAAGKEQARVHDVQTCQAILDGASAGRWGGGALCACGQS